MIRTMVAGLLAGWLTLSCAQAQDGAELYEEHCASCHGEKLRSAGTMPDLRELGPDDRARFDKAVLEGRGQMPGWQGVLSVDEIDQVWDYVRRNAR
jgi:mono/diheme cytochrome c family protein